MSTCVGSFVNENFWGCKVCKDLYSVTHKNSLFLWNIENSLDLQHKEGKKEGLKEKTIEIAKNIILKGFDNQFLTDIAGLTIEQIEKLRKKI